MAACAPSEAVYPDAFASSYCRRLKDCGESQFFALHPRGTPACLEDLTIQVEDYAFGLPVPDRAAESETVLCTFETESAVAALSTLAEATCAELPRASWVESTASSAWDCVILKAPARAH